MLKKISKTLKARAVDDEYFYFEDNLSFYHAHLKISDLDKDTSQPFLYKDFVIGLVGEIYNKDKLLNKVGIFQDEDYFSELQVIGLCYEKFGEKFIDYVNGEFAIFIYDRSLNKIILYRDRWGTNNIYFKIRDGNLYFASEIKSLIFSYSDAIISKEALIQFMTFQFCISPSTIIDGVFSLRPGNYLEFYIGGKYFIRNFGSYEFQESSTNLIETVERSIVRRIPKFHERLFLSLSGGPDSNLILYFLKKHYKGDIVAYSFLSKKNEKEIEIAKYNTKKIGVKHLLIDLDNLGFDFQSDLYNHEGLVNLRDLGKILRCKFPEYKNIKVEFGGDGKEELILGNNHFPYKKIISRYKYFKKNKLIKDFQISQEFLNKEMFDYNLQMIDKITLRNGIERRLPFTDYELLRYYKFKNYRKIVEDFLNSNGIKVVDGEFGYNLGIGFKYLYDEDLLKIKNVFLEKIKTFL